MYSSLDNQGLISPVAGYAFGNADERARIRHRQLSELYDAQTIHHLERRGISKGWLCLEVGDGAGSITSWLCEHIGNAGRVLSTSIEPCFLQTLSFRNLEVRRLDIRADELPQRRFDLVHARLALMHLPGRELALERMLRSVKRGGWIVIEEFDASSLLLHPAINPEQEELKTISAFYEAMVSRGVEMRYGRWLEQQLRARRLVNIGAEATICIWQGPSTGIEFLKLSCEELRESVIASGAVAETEFEADMNRIERDFLVPSPTMWTAWGQVPEF